MLGGISEPDCWDTDIDLGNCGAVRDILERCRQFMPVLQYGRLDEVSVTVGLRPARKRNVRLEHEPRHAIFHNYGHGGSGFSLSWGCAEEIAELVAASNVSLPS